MPGRLIRYFVSQDRFGLRVACALACVPSAGSLLLKVYGIAEMHHAVPFIFLPCAVFLMAVWRFGRAFGAGEVSDAIALGAVGGLFATFAYDLIRVPFMLAGIHVFMSIDTYGLWIVDARHSSGFTDVIGWTYHFSNGITFGIIYALFMRGQHWLWAVLYAIVLETINLISPFMEIFRLSSNYLGIFILYLGHVAYGMPLGLMTQRWEASLQRMRATPRLVWMPLLACGLGWLCAEAFLPARAAKDARATAGVLKVEGAILNPELIRLGHPGGLTLVNSSPDPVMVLDRTTNQTYAVRPGGEARAAFARPGIYQLHVSTPERTHSSFAIVEPVAETGR
jgi:hypothetical protein